MSTLSSRTFAGEGLVDLLGIPREKQPSGSFATEIMTLTGHGSR